MIILFYDTNYYINRSLDWVCPSCGVANRTALPEGVEGEDKEKTVAKEMEEIVSQMAIKVRVLAIKIYSSIFDLSLKKKLMLNLNNKFKQRNHHSHPRLLCHLISHMT